MIRPILKLGDRGLQSAAAPVTVFDDALDTLLRDMAETMYSVPGIGLAAPQIGVPLRVFVIDLSVGKTTGELIELVNPASVLYEVMQLEEEGCLSLPGFNATVVRPSHAIVKGFDRHGHEKTVERARDTRRGQLARDEHLLHGGSVRRHCRTNRVTRPGAGSRHEQQSGPQQLFSVAAAMGFPADFFLVPRMNALMKRPSIPSAIPASSPAPVRNDTASSPV